jgi:hypothetical protein
MPRNPTPIQAAVPAAPPARTRSTKATRTVADAAPAVADPVPQAAEEAEYQDFLAFQNVAAENSRRALGGRRGTRLP